MNFFISDELQQFYTNAALGIALSGKCAKKHICPIGIT